MNVILNRSTSFSSHVLQQSLSKIHSDTEQHFTDNICKVRCQINTGGTVCESGFINAEGENI